MLKKQPQGSFTNYVDKRRWVGSPKVYKVENVNLKFVSSDLLVNFTEISVVRHTEISVVHFITEISVRLTTEISVKLMSKADETN